MSDEGFPEGLLDAVREVVEENPEAAEDHRAGEQAAERHLVREVMGHAGPVCDPDTIVAAVREVTGGGPPSPDEVRRDVADAVREADAGIAILVGFDDGEVDVEVNSRWFDDDAMSDVEQIAAAKLLEFAVEDLDVPEARRGESDGAVQATAIPMSGEGLAAMLGGGNAPTPDDLDTGAGFQ